MVETNKKQDEKRIEHALLANWAIIHWSDRKRRLWATMRRETPRHSYTLVKLDKSIHMVHNLNAITWHADKHIHIRAANELHVLGFFSLSNFGVICFELYSFSLQIFASVGQLWCESCCKELWHIHYPIYSHINNLMARIISYKSLYERSLHNLPYRVLWLIYFRRR